MYVARARWFFTVVVVAAGCCAVATTALAQPKSYTTVASPIVVRGDVSNGDLVSYDAETGTCHPSKLPADEMMYGVVVFDPVMYLDDPNIDAEGTPVVRYGEVVVNVTTINGAIQAGDLITTSFVAGKGQRIDRDEGAYVIGFALENMTTTPGETFEVDGITVQVGTVPVALRIGPYVTKQGAEFVATSTVNGILASQGIDPDEGVDYFRMFRFVLGAMVAVGSVLLATRRFGDAFSQSVISVGRNPLAQSRIRSMLLWNTLLIIIISCIGLGVGVAIVLAP